MRLNYLQLGISVTSKTQPKLSLKFQRKMKRIGLLTVGDMTDQLQR